MGAWKNRVLEIFGIEVTIIEKLIDEVTSLFSKGRKFYRERSTTNSVVANFLKDNKKGNSRRWMVAGMTKPP